MTFQVADKAIPQLLSANLQPLIGTRAKLSRERLIEATNPMPEILDLFASQAKL